MEAGRPAGDSLAGVGRQRSVFQSVRAVRPDARTTGRSTRTPDRDRPEVVRRRTVRADARDALVSVGRRRDVESRRHDPGRDRRPRAPRYGDPHPTRLAQSLGLGPATKQARQDRPRHRLAPTSSVSPEAWCEHPFYGAAVVGVVWPRVAAISSFMPWTKPRMSEGGLAARQA